MPLNSHKDLIVWQRAMELAKSVYQLTETFPATERFGLISQTRKSAVSIPSNIAEGRARGTRKDFSNFLRIAYGSASELETQIELSQSLSFGVDTRYNKTKTLLIETLRMLNAMLGKLEAKS